MKTVFGHPSPRTAKVDSAAGIQQVVLNLQKHLPDFGWELIDTPNADLFAHHAGSGEGATDVAICHGFHPTGMPNSRTNNWHHEINHRVAQDIHASLIVTTPSEWVADIIRRDFHLSPTVIQWEVDAFTFERKANTGGVLWAKNRNEGVCNPTWVERLAKEYPSQRFITTFADKRYPNLEVIGKVPHERMIEIIAEAQIYLSTTKETGDIAAREALAHGVPVLGFRQGALPDFVKHGVNGFLAEPDDFDGLADGLGWIQTHYGRIADNAWNMSRDWSWRHVAEQFAEVFDRAHYEKTRPKTIGVVIPCYNYGEYLGDAIKSVLNQTLKPKRLVIVDDASTDNTLEAISQATQDVTDIEIVTQSHDYNQGVGNARNDGILLCSRLDYVVCLDADDTIEPDFLKKCFEALERDRRAAVAYTRLREKNSGAISQWLASDYRYEEHANGMNQVPTCAMFRVADWKRVGGYIQDFHPSEDAEFWLRLLSYCGHAVRASNEALFNYNMHAGSASQTLAQKDWRGDKGWLTVGNFPIAVAQGIMKGVRNYDAPDISVIIPVGSGHADYVKQAIRSIENQSFWNWEVIVVDDIPDFDLSGALKAFPYAKIIKTKGGQGAGAARNVGINFASGKTILFLDADDTLAPTALDELWYALNQYGGYVYSDYYAVHNDGRKIKYSSLPFTPRGIFKNGLLHPVTALIPTVYVQNIGGFDKNLASWEDLEFYMHLVASGVCGTRIAKPLLNYYIERGKRRGIGAESQTELTAHFREQYAEFIVEGKTPVCECNKPPDPIGLQASSLDNESLIRVRFKGAKAGIQLKIGGTPYGYRKDGDEFYIFAKHLDTRRFEQLPESVELPQRRTVIPA